MTPRRKLEKAVARDFLTVARFPALAGIPVYPGLNAEVKEAVRVHCVVSSIAPAPGFEPLAGLREYVGVLSLQFVIPAHGLSETQVDEYDDLISDIQREIEADGENALGDVINAPDGEDAPEDVRTIKGLHIYQAEIAEHALDPQPDGYFQDSLNYNIQFADVGEPVPEEGGEG